MKSLPQTRKRLFRKSAPKAYAAAAGLVIPTLWVFGGFALVSSALSLPLVLIPIVIGTGIIATFLQHYVQRVEADDDGLRVVNSLNRTVATIPWSAIARYSYRSRFNGRGSWMIRTKTGENFSLPNVEEAVDLQRTILSRITPGVLQGSGKARPAKLRPVTQEVHEANYRAITDYINLGTCIGLTVIGGFGAFALSLWVLDMESTFTALGGFAAGILIVLAGFLIRHCVNRIRKEAAGRKIDMTKDGIEIREGGQATSMRWRDLQLVEKAWLYSSEKEAVYYVLFDGTNSIAYREGWRHSDSLLRYVATETGPDTVFAGFE